MMVIYDGNLCQSKKLLGNHDGNLLGNHKTQETMAIAMMVIAMMAIDDGDHDG